MNLPVRPLVLSAFIFAARAFAQAPELVWETGGFIAPESAVFDTVRNQYYVSNMGTHGNGSTPGDGFISRVSADGKILDLKWVTGFDNPKGLALANGRLYVGDDKDLVEIDLAAAAVAARYQPEDGPGSFNDCTADPAGNVYVCSGRLGTVFRLSSGKFAPWFKVDRTKTGGINGLRAEKDRLLLGGWTLRGPDGQEQLGHISIVAYADQTFSRIGDQPLARCDGIEPDGTGSYTVTDWLSGDVLHVAPDGKVAKLMSLGRGTADHLYRIEEKLLIIPQMMEHKLRAYRWSPVR